MGHRECGFFYLLKSSSLAAHGPITEAQDHDSIMPKTSQPFRTGLEPPPSALLPRPWLTTQERQLSFELSSDRAPCQLTPESRPGARPPYQP